MIMQTVLTRQKRNHSPFVNAAINSCALVLSESQTSIIIGANQPGG